MRRKAVSEIMLTLLLIGMLTSILSFALGIQPVKASGAGQYDWPMYHYDPACTGFSPSSAPNINATAWVADLPGGTGWAYPVVTEGKVFIGAGGQLNAFDENDGSFLWSFKDPEQPGYPVCSAAAEGRVFFGTAEPGPGGCIYALNATTGEQIWNFTTDLYNRAPVVAEDRLYFGVDLDNTGKVYCINATTGVHVWNYTTQDKGVSVAVAYGKVYVGCGHWITPTKCRIYCFDMYNNSLLWNFDTGRDIGGVGAVANGKVYLTSSYEGWDCMVYALNATNGDVVWSTSRYPNGEAGRVAVAYGKVFITLGYGAKGIYALNETNGDEIWAFPGERIFGGPVVADGKVFFARGDPPSMFYAVNETTGAVVWSHKLGGGVHSMSLAIANGRVFVADHYDQKLYAFGGPYSELTVTSSPITGITFIINGVPQTTPYTEWLLEGSYTIEMPETHNGYVWSHWLEDGDTSRTKTITLPGTTWTGVFTSAPPPPPPPAVGGEMILIKVDKPPPLAPTHTHAWIGLVSAIISTVAVSVVYAKNRKRKQTE